MRRNADYDTGTSDMLRDQASTYAGELPLTDPAISRLSMEVAGLPPLLVQVGGAELLEDECCDFVVIKESARGRGDRG